MLLETSMHNMKPAQGFSGSCAGLSFPLNHHYLNRTAQCIPKCGTDVLFAKEDKKFAEIWLAVWSILCFLTTLFTLGTYILDTTRFKYPEKCIVFLNLSYNILSTGYLLRLMVGVSGVSCTSIQGEPSLVVRQGLSPTPACTIIFILVYFSSLAAAVWWTITTATWTIVVFSSLDVKLLEVKSPLFHLIGWGIPAALTISSLVLHQTRAVCTTISTTTSTTHRASTATGSPAPTAHRASKWIQK
ncbi:frizzled-10 [Eurytemora carolleeae]|uniref:frizzled-10 n=1 Tax=Eurytemora carolleeae TaxID=1294199 RepID=UPI000C7678AC|nr:frizzled-10 [Eurytemora carolleeae]|eukprot:XP_023340848.1 frizzled-10-like [Eurytemora affinis]